MPTGTLGTTITHDYHRRQTTYVGGQVLTTGTNGNWLGSAAGVQKLGTIPAGSSIRSFLCLCKVANNAGGPLVLCGTSAGDNSIFASAAGGTGTAGLTSNTVIAAAANVALAADTDIWVTNNSSAATATSGQMQFFVEYLVP